MTSAVQPARVPRRQAQADRFPAAARPPAAGRAPGRRRPPGTLAAAVLVAGLVLVAAAADALAPYPPRAAVSAPVQRPSAAHPLGTNDLGQDLLSLWLHGARTSLAVGFVAAGASTALSGAAGLLSVLWRAGRVPLLGLMDALLALPNLPIVVLLLALLGPGFATLVAALALVGWPAYARVVRVRVQQTLARDYVEAARAFGATDARIVRTCLLPAVAPVLWTKFLLTVRWAILMEAAVALMGLGDATRVSWGGVLHTAFTYPLLFAGDAWAWWALPPAAAIAGLTAALSVVGRDFAAWLNPGMPRQV